MIKWTAEDDLRATAEGWGLFATDSSLQLQADYESGVFVSGTTAHDDLAWFHVYEEANKGSGFHRRALNYIQQESPVEYNLIMEHVNANSPSYQAVG